MRECLSSTLLWLLHSNHRLIPRHRHFVAAVPPAWRAVRRSVGYRSSWYQGKCVRATWPARPHHRDIGPDSYNKRMPQRMCTHLPRHQSSCRDISHQHINHLPHRRGRQHAFFLALPQLHRCTARRSARPGERDRFHRRVAVQTRGQILC